MKPSTKPYLTSKLIVCTSLFLMPFIYSCGGGSGTASTKDSTAMSPSADTVSKSTMSADTTKNKLDTGGKGNQLPPPTNH